MGNKLDSFQVSLLNKTGVPWAEKEEGLDIDVNQLSSDTLEELIGAGCFTYPEYREGMPVGKMHALHFQAALKHAHRFVKEDQPMGGNVLRRSIVEPRKVGGLDVLVYPITQDGVDTGMYKIAWGNP